MCTPASGTVDPASIDILAAARTAQAAKMRDRKRDAADEAMLAEVLAEFGATVVVAPLRHLPIIATGSARGKCVLALVEATHVADA